MNRWYNFHIKNEILLWFFLVSIAPIVILFSINYFFQKERFVSQAKNQLEIVLHEKVSKINAYMETLEHDIKLIANIPYIIDNFKESKENFHKEHKSSISVDLKIMAFLNADKYHDLLFIDLEGNVIYSLKKENDLKTNLLYGVYKDTNLASVYKDTKMFLETKISDFLYYPPSDTHAAFMAHPVYEEGSLLGVIAIQLNQERLFEIFQTQGELGESGETFAAYKNQHNKTLSATPLRYMQNSVKNEYEFPDIENISSKKAIIGDQGSGITRDYRNVEVVAAWDYIPLLHWGVVAKIDSSEVLKPINELEFYSIIVLFFVMVVVVFAIIVATKHIVNPIYGLIERVKRISKGNLDEEELYESQALVENEIGILSINFNEMALNLKNSQDTIRKYANELEEKVRIRTSELESAKDELSEANFSMKRYLAVVDRYVIISSTDLGGTITDASSAFCSITGYTKEELLGKKHNIVRHPNMPKELYKEMWETLLNNGIWNGEIQNLKKDGSSYWVFTTISPTYDKNGNKIGYTSIRQDITHQKMVEELSIKDRLTSLYNRLKLETVFEDEINRSLRYATVFSVIMADIDHFKAINDTYGHDVGDDTLVDFARILKQSVRETDIVGRWGGEEFLLILPQTDMEAAQKLAEKLRQNIEEHSFKTIKSCTASFGVSSYMPQDDMNRIVKRADSALYESKKSGRNRVSLA